MTLSRAVILVNLLLLTAAAYLGVGIFYEIAGARINPPEAAASVNADTAPAKTSGSHAFAYYRPVLDRDLFDTVKIPQAPPAENELNVDELEETELKLKLWGTVSGDDTRAYAVIEDLQKREQNLYRIGDTIQNATVKKIMRARVVLSQDGRDEVLAMEEIQQSGAGSRTVSSRSARFAPRPATQPVRRTQRVSLRRDMIDNAMQDISKLMTEIVIRPHVEDGQAAGLAMTNIKPNSIFRRMGLRNGDVLKGVNGREIRSVDDALQLYESLKDSDSVQVQLNRRGQERVIDYNIR